MYRLKHGTHKVVAHTAEGSLGTTLVENFSVAGRLQHGHVVFLLVLPDFAAYAHTLGEKIHQLVVEIVNLVEQLGDAFRGNGLVADDEQVEYVVKHVGCYLLLGVAPCFVRIAVALHDEPVEAEVHGLLAEWGDEFTTASGV